MGDVADQATRTLGMIDEVALKWLFPPGHPFRAQYGLKGDQMLLSSGSTRSTRFHAINFVRSSAVMTFG